MIYQSLLGHKAIVHRRRGETEQALFADMAWRVNTLISLEEALFDKDLALIRKCCDYSSESDCRFCEEILQYYGKSSPDELPFFERDAYSRLEKLTERDRYIVALALRGFDLRCG